MNKENALVSESAYALSWDDVVTRMRTKRLKESLRKSRGRVNGT